MRKINLFRTLFCVFLIISIPLCFAKEYSLSYDDNGNLVNDGKLNYEYNSEKQLSGIRYGNSTGDILAEFFYDGQGNRIKKVEYFPKEKTTYYIDGSVIEKSSDSLKTTDYISDSQNIIASTSGNSTSFYIHDHLGSTRAVLDEEGNVIQKIDYLPFGTELDESDERYTYTGQEKELMGLMFYNSRYYSPYLRSFIQPDTVIPDVYDPQSLNRYSYARNNPVKYNDPSGHFICGGACLFIAGLAAWTIGGAVVRSAWDLGSQIWNGASLSDGSVDWSSVSRSAVSGGVGGFVAGLTQGIVSPVVSGAPNIISGASTAASYLMTGSVAEQATSNLLSGQSITNNVAESAASGAVWGGAMGALFGSIADFKGGSSATHTSPKHTSGKLTARGYSPSQSIAIGRNGERVKAFANEIGVKSYKQQVGKSYSSIGDRAVSNNKAWFSDKLRKGYTIFDIGPDPKNPNDLGYYYGPAELEPLQRWMKAGKPVKYFQIEGVP